MNKSIQILASLSTHNFFLQTFYNFLCLVSIFSFIFLCLILKYLVTLTLGLNDSFTLNENISFKYILLSLHTFHAELFPLLFLVVLSPYLVIISNH